MLDAYACVTIDDDVTFDLGFMLTSMFQSSCKHTCTYNTQTSLTVSSATTIFRSPHARQHCSPVVTRIFAWTTHTRTLSPHCFPEWARSESSVRNSGRVVVPLYYNAFDEGHSDLSEAFTFWALQDSPLRPLGSVHWLSWFWGCQSKIRPQTIDSRPAVLPLASCRNVFGLDNGLLYPKNTDQCYMSVLELSVSTRPDDGMPLRQLG
jgi:hypothetical protein